MFLAHGGIDNTTQLTFDRRSDITAHWWNITSHTVQWGFNVLNEGSNDIFYLPAIPSVFMAEMLLLEHIMSLKLLFWGHLYYFLSACVIFHSPLVILEREKGRQWDK